MKKEEDDDGDGYYDGDGDEGEENGNGNGDESKGGGGYLDTRDEAREVWLVKVPDFLYRHWKDSSSSSSTSSQNQPLGKIRTITRGNRVELEIEVETAGTDLPKDYSFRDQPSSSTAYVFSEAPEGNRITGIVATRFQIRPELNEQFSRFSRSQLGKQPPVRASQRVDARDANDSLLFEQPKRPKLATPDRAAATATFERMEPEKVRQMIFVAFDNYSQWTLADLTEQLRQPKAYVEQLVDSLCDFQQVGNKKYLMLKNQHRVHPPMHEGPAPPK